jgi:hypothetical protein
MKICGIRRRFRSRSRFFERTRASESQWGIRTLIALAQSSRTLGLRLRLDSSTSNMRFTIHPNLAFHRVVMDNDRVKARSRRRHCCQLLATNDWLTTNRHLPRHTDLRNRCWSTVMVEPSPSRTLLSLVGRHESGTQCSETSLRGLAVLFGCATTGPYSYT